MSPHKVHSQPETETRLSLLGHPGHLTHDQDVTLGDFKELLSEAGLYTPENATLSQAASHSDATLLRYLRARSFVPSKALKQFADHEAWRQKMDIDNLFANFPPEEFAAAQQFYPMWIGRRDKMGYPIHVYRLQSLHKHVSAINAVPNEQRYETISVLYEFLMKGTTPLSSKLPSGSFPTPIDGTTTVVDLEGVSFSLVWGLKSHLQQASVLANANYPETMGMTWIINAPSFFPTVWGWLKGWFDEGTRRKFHILTKSMQHKLLDEIAPRDLPRAYGGELDWSFGDAPLLDEPAKEVMKDFGGRCPVGPWGFVDGVPMLGKDMAEAAERGASSESTASTLQGNEVVAVKLEVPVGPPATQTIEA